VTFDETKVYADDHKTRGNPDANATEDTLEEIDEARSIESGSDTELGADPVMYPNEINRQQIPQEVATGGTEDDSDESIIVVASRPQQPPISIGKR
jgi:hypothetical protein